MEEVNNERIMLSKLKHTSIVGMKSAWADKQYFYFLIDYAVNGDLTNFLQTYGKYHLKIYIEYVIIKFISNRYPR